MISKRKVHSHKTPIVEKGKAQFIKIEKQKNPILNINQKRLKNKVNRRSKSALMLTILRRLPLLKVL